MFNFPDAPVVGDEYTSGSATYLWDGLTWNLKSGAAMTDYVLKAGDTMSGSLVMEDGISFGEATVSDPNDCSRHISLWDAPAYGLSVTSGRLNYIVAEPVNKHVFRIGTNDIAQIDSSGIGPRTSHNVVFQNGFSGTMDFRVNPVMVTMRITDLKRNVSTAERTNTKICDYPAGVPAPWGTLRVLAINHNTQNTVASSGYTNIEARVDGVWLFTWDGCVINNSDHRLDGTLTWSR